MRPCPAYEVDTSCVDTKGTQKARANAMLRGFIIPLLSVLKAQICFKSTNHPWPHLQGMNTYIMLWAGGANPPTHPQPPAWGGSVRCRSHIFRRHLVKPVLWLLGLPAGPPLLATGMPSSDHRASRGVARSCSNCGSCCRTLSLTVVVLLLLRLLLLLGRRRLLRGLRRCRWRSRICRLRLC
jgi:hypothetical protein